MKKKTNIYNGMKAMIKQRNKGENDGHLANLW